MHDNPNSGEIFVEVLTYFTFSWQVAGSCNSIMFDQDAGEYFTTIVSLLMSKDFDQNASIQTSVKNNMHQVSVTWVQLTWQMGETTRCMFTNCLMVRTVFGQKSNQIKKQTPESCCHQQSNKCTFKYPLLSHVLCKSFQSLCPQNNWRC